MINADILGRFVWHELVTTDADAAGEFYPQVTGWEAHPWEKDPSYTLWMTPQGPMGGVMSLPGDDEDAEAPPHWLPYIGTSDIDATVKAAQRLGGRVEKDITEIASIGRFAVLSDPLGAMFAVLEPEEGSSSANRNGAAPQVGGFSWHELSTSDHEAAFEFYQELFGWEQDGAHDMGGEMGTYLMFSHGGAQIGGMYNKPSEASGTASWLCYVSVKAASDAADAAKAAGGQVVNGPMEVPGGDVIVQMVDPQGAAFAVHESKKAVEGAKAAKPKRSKKKPAAKPVMAEEAAMEAAPPATLESDEAEEQAEAEEPVARPTKARKSAAKSKAGAKTKGGKKKAAGKKAAAKKAPAKKAPAKKAAVKKGAVKKGAGKKATKMPARKGAKKSAAARSVVARGKAARKTPAKSAVSKRPAAKKAAARKKR
jgi:hypothetical protein